MNLKNMLIIPIFSLVLVSFLEAMEEVKKEELDVIAARSIQLIDPKFYNSEDFQRNLKNGKFTVEDSLTCIKEMFDCMEYIKDKNIINFELEYINYLNSKK